MYSLPSQAPGLAEFVQIFLEVCWVKNSQPDRDATGLYSFTGEQLNGTQQTKVTEMDMVGYNKAQPTDFFSLTYSNGYRGVVGSLPFLLQLWFVHCWTQTSHNFQDSRQLVSIFVCNFLNTSLGRDNMFQQVRGFFWSVSRCFALSWICTAKLTCSGSRVSSSTHME